MLNYSRLSFVNRMSASESASFATLALVGEGDTDVREEPLDRIITAHVTAALYVPLRAG